MPSYWANRSQQREWLSQFCEGIGLDIGCGYKKIVPDAIGLDMREYDPLCVADVIGNSYRLPFRNESMNYMIACHVLEHFSNPVSILLEFYRVLKSRGILALAVPDSERAPETMYDPLHLFGFTEFNLLQIVQANGFEPQKLCKFNEGGWPCLTLSALRKE